MIRPATLEDLFSLVVRGDEAATWYAILAADNLEEIIEKNKMVVGVCGDEPYFCVGVGSIRLSASSVPWVWAAVDVSAKQKLKHFMREDRQAIKDYLDSHANLAYTAPEGDSPVYTRFLRYMGFVHLGWGLWQWRS